MEGWLILGLFLIGPLLFHFASQRRKMRHSPVSRSISLRESSFRIRLRDVQIETDDRTIPAKEIQALGPFPLKTTEKIAAWISILDENDEKAKPVFCVIERFREADSPAYFSECEFGVVSPGYSIPEWAPIGIIFPEILRPPRSGQLELTVIVRLVDLSALSPVVSFGFLKSNPLGVGVLWHQKVKFTHQFKEKGYLEAAAHREEAQILTLKIAMAVAMSDNSLHEREGLLIKKWIKQSLTPFAGEKEARLKEVFNQTLQESYAEAKRGVLDLEALANRLNDIGETSDKYHALELGADIMAVDGSAHTGEIKILNDLAKLFGLNIKRVAEILDTRLIKLDPAKTNEASAEDLIGIKPGWSKERIKKHLISEFGKWNSRLNTLPEGKERDNAQRMLNLIAEVRKKYDE